MYIEPGITSGILPASTRISPSDSVSSFSYSFLISASPIAGPCPLISVSSLERSFTLILEIPFSTLIKSARTPFSSNRSCILFPVNPARKPSAVFSKPRFFKTMETLIPFPPGKIISSVVRFTIPQVKLSTETM